ncbi:eukaryotic translation initiation factor-like protein subunit eIF2B-gamma [Neohortaea acidophila]|uniref:Translation initiation factor eIF2B subunit gamma n=1 Tax=Neohortaea acidophila TaxID=245834 RepID=A0A6A6PP34_9PEZI|nr:eukaryotic translation initiation factor-like protein subunit eIF2B-gamma [Neohortaea acidophila]KAF2481027.1 eukaryotic translation initiation factor-like protein subunit eIF2B-gamma [Neohortaea acidophila]
MPHATLPSPGLQALILCGPGSSLSTFTSNPADFPKAIVPIANRPMVWYPLDWCYRMGVSDITLVTPPESLSALESALATNPALTSLPSPKPLVLAPAELTQTTGTAQLLRLPEVQKIITSDFVVLPCDLISELDGTHLLQQWMTLNPLWASSAAQNQFKGGLTLFYPTHGLENISHKKDETDFLATVPLPTSHVPSPSTSLRPNIERVVQVMPTDTLHDLISEKPEPGYLRLRQSMLAKHGRVKMRMKLRDAHVYVLPRWVKEFAARNDRFDSISEDVLGWWAKADWQEGLAEKLQLTDILRGTTEVPNDDEEDDQVDVAAMSSTKAARSPVQHLGSETAFASRVGTSTTLSTKKPVVIPPLLAYVQPAPSTPLIRRVDTTHQLLNVSLHLAKQPITPASALSHEHKIHPTATLEQQSRVSAEDSLVGENVRIGFRSNIKESVIGANCNVGKNVRLTRCLLMEGCVVGDGVQLVGCVLGRRAVVVGQKALAGEGSVAVGEGSTQGESATKSRKKGKGAAGDGDDDDKTRLTDCEVAPNFVVEAGTEAKGEKFMGFDTGDMGLDDDEDLEDGDLDDEV